VAGAKPDFDLIARIIRDQRVRDLTELVHRFHETNHMQPIPLPPPHAVE